MYLHKALAQHIAAWREENYKQEEYPAISEILEWVRNPDVPLFKLRSPQVRALETYWYLRLVENTPHIFDLNTYDDWAAKIKRRRHTGDFSNWKDEARYQKAFERLLRDLKATGGGVNGE